MCNPNNDRVNQLLLAVVLRHAIGSLEVLEDILRRTNDDPPLQRVLRGWQRALHQEYKRKTGGEYIKPTIQ